MTQAGSPRRLGRAVRALALAAVGLATGSAFAWSNHALATWPALSVMPELTSRAPVKVESLASFLAADPTALAKVLQDEEAWARSHVPTYPARPDALAFAAEPGDPSALVARFVAAVRINPASRLALFLQLPPGQPTGTRPVLKEADVTPLKTTEATKFDTFVALREGELVPVVDVIATATDEPDYGLDIGLWADNGTPYGARYGFGKQPFGNPALEFSSQGPMHIGFFHESAIIYKAAPFLQRTYPEYRIHLWQTLAAHALRTGHPYWGWRFGGWALHYIQDLTQPYHSRVLPGVGTTRMLWINSLDLAGVHGPKEHAITFVSNRHLALENYQLRWLRAAHLGKLDKELAMLALRDTSHDAESPWRDDSPRQVVSQEANDAADATDAMLVASVPAKYTSDPAFSFGVTESGLDLYAAMASASPASQAAMNRTIAPLLGRFGAHTRAFVRTLLAGAH